VKYVKVVYFTIIFFILIKEEKEDSDSSVGSNIISNSRFSTSPQYPTIAPPPEPSTSYPPTQKVLPSNQSAARKAVSANEEHVNKRD
jgi:hypothetical protein